ncbi:arylsulfatase [Kaistia sp. 32K]|uniref:arylsulfatase n=1 Tax=Kaistia sp. 32K TaxID=2795690 RepID=UPI00191568D1|nr:arylsulfatase [Kaistia sp. 32K]BCP52441.1 arylsulfatase [Kaistia sp. 32K]
MKPSARLLYLGCAMIGATMAPALPATAQEQKPNIVFILLDNTGWGDLGVYGGMTPTPRIDKLASEGIRFNSYYVEAQCTPTRSAIMTGRQSVRSGTYTVPLPGTGPYGLSPWEHTLPELLSEAGYATALYGKWHLGEVPGRLPSDMGFDEWWGIKNSWDEAGYTSYPLFKESGVEVPMIWQGRKGEASTPVMPLDLNVRPIVDEKYIIPKTVDFIQREAAAKKPFFVYVGYSEMHPPAIPNPNFAGKSVERGGAYSDLVGEMDVRVGQILDAIKQAGIDNDTMVILSSDNATAPSLVAGAGGGSDGPFRGGFFTPPFEGSMRTLAMVRWPGHVPTGIVTQEILSAHDWLPTLAGVAGRTDLVPKDRPIDGIDASAFLLGKSATTGRDSYMQFGPDGELMSVRWKVYKTILRYSEGVDKPIVKPQFPMQFDLTSDPHENWNLFNTKLTEGWSFAPVARLIIAYEESLKKYPNIRPGEDFKGYK